jgi:hypothetical protein
MGNVFAQLVSYSGGQKACPPSFAKDLNKDLNNSTNRTWENPVRFFT